MGEKSIKEIMDERFGVHQIPRRQVSREEMDKMIIEAKERGKTKSVRKKLSKDEDQTDQPGIPCPGCNENKWMKLRDSTGRYYCLKCGEVIQPTYVDLQGAKKTTELQKTPAPASSCDGNVNSDSSKQIDDSEKNMRKTLFPFHCDQCNMLVQFQGTNIEIAMEKAILHKKYDPKTKCNGTFTLLKHNNEMRPVIPNESTGIADKFYHPKSDKFICGGCFDLNQCPQTSQHMEICLNKNIDLKLKAALELLTEILKTLSKNVKIGGD